MMIGIVGGGQLGLMMAEAAIPLGHTVVGLDPEPSCPLSHVAQHMIIAPYDDPSAIHDLAAQVDVLTYEFENVDATRLSPYEEQLPQTTHALVVAKDRWNEKTFAVECGIPTPRFARYRDKKDAVVPSIIKTTKGGYDGKGQYWIRTEEDLANAPDQVDDFAYLMEDIVPFDYEISVIATRDQAGNIVTYPIPINTHEQGILRTSYVGTDIPKSIQDEAVRLTRVLITRLSYVGTLAVEYFVWGDQVLFNEFAPRPHNSGHYSIEGCDVSQFENHIRAITGMAVVSPTLRTTTLMINELGQDPPFSQVSWAGCTYHDYHKTERRAGRKMGHMTCLLGPEVNRTSIVNRLLGEPYEPTNLD
jgi:5-(carboxyamino)imidazole ribonucleotide synthase